MLTCGAGHDSFHHAQAGARGTAVGCGFGVGWGARYAAHHTDGLHGVADAGQFVRAVAVAGLGGTEPFLHDAVFAHGEERGSVARVRQFQNGFLVGEHGVNQLRTIAVGLPDADALVHAGGGEMRLVRAPLQGIKPIGRFAEGVEPLPGRGDGQPRTNILMMLAVNDRTVPFTQGVALARTTGLFGRPSADNPEPYRAWTEQAIASGLLEGKDVAPPLLDPGKAGGGEELGGERGLRHYLQRTAIQGDTQMLRAVFGKIDAAPPA